MKKKKKGNVYGVIGIGRFGIALAKELALAGEEVLVVDSDEEQVREARQFTENAFVSPDLSLESLRQMGFGECDTVIVCIGGQIDINLLTTLNVINLGVPHVIAKAASQNHGVLLEKIGAEVVFPERDMGVRLAKKLRSNTVMEYINLSNDIDMMEVSLPDCFNGMTVMECNIRRNYELNIIAIQRGETTSTNVRPDDVLEEGDVLLLIGKNKDIERFLEENH